MAQNINEVIEELVELARTTDLTTESFNELLESVDETPDAFDKVTDATKKTAAGLGTFTKELANGTANFNSFANVISSAVDGIADQIGVLGLPLKAFSKGLSFAIAKFQESADAFEKVADAGAIGAEGLTGLRDAAADAQIPLKMYSEMLINSSKDLTQIYGTATKGAKAFETTMLGIQEGQHDTLRFLGFSMESTKKAIIDYAKLQKRLGYEQENDVKALRHSANAYGKELDLLSRLTGESKDALRAQRDEALKDTKFRAVVEGASNPQQKKLLQDLQLLVAKRLGTEAGDMVKVGVTGIPDSTATSDRLMLRGELFSVLSEFGIKTRMGTATDEDMIEAYNTFAKTAVELKEPMQSLALIGSDAGDIAGNFPDIAEQANKASTLWLTKQLTDSMRDEQGNIKVNDPQGKAAKVAEQAILRMTTKIEELVNKLFPTAKVVTEFSDALTSAANGIDTFIDSSGGLKGIYSKIDTFGTKLNTIVDGILTFMDKWGIIDYTGSSQTGYDPIDDKGNEVKDAKDDLLEAKKDLKLAKSTDNISQQQMENLENKVKDAEKVVAVTKAAYDSVNTVANKLELDKERIQDDIESKKDLISARKKNLSFFKNRRDEYVKKNLGDIAFEQSKIMSNIQTNLSELESELKALETNKVKVQSTIDKNAASDPLNTGYKANAPVTSNSFNGEQKVKVELTQPLGDFLTNKIDIAEPIDSTIRNTPKAIETTTEEQQQQKTIETDKQVQLSDKVSLLIDQTTQQTILFQQFLNNNTEFNKKQIQQNTTMLNNSNKQNVLSDELIYASTNIV